ncbi:hypothetical protein GIB67_016007 [Kingdonia uniflora]|uniref:Uncharacterized protein n=1 Tax=Kingdonia uniflora TaxID=39325 RepID=A0A7J7L1P3_9MAGN|nr:hypothetical protein GIB67_016007 [Kingdonia uniflora]
MFLKTSITELSILDGSDPENVRKVVQDFLQYGKRNEESVAELFVTLLSKLASVETLWPKGLCASTYEGSWISKTWEYKVCLMNVEDFMDRSENSARSVGGAALKKIYRCINSSLHHLSSFMDGRIQAPKLKELLFGRDSPSTADEHSALSLKGSLPFHEGEGATPPDQVPMKKTRLTEGWSSWGEKQQPPLTMRPWGGNQLRPSTLQPCGRKQVSPSAWPPWGEDRSSPSTWPPWGENQSLPSTWHPWGEDQSPTPTRQPWGEDQLPTSTWHPWGEDQLSPSITRSWGENQLSPSTVGSWRRDESSHSAWRPWGENQSSSPSWQPCAEVQSFPSAWRSWGEDQCGGTPAGFSHSTPFVHPQ